MNKVILYDIDWKHSGVSELEVDISKKRDREHLEDFLRNWFIDEYNELPLSYEIKDFEKYIPKTKIRKYTYKDLSKDIMNDIKKLIHKYENEGDYYMDENDIPQLRTSKDVVEDLRKIIS